MTHFDEIFAEAAFETHLDLFGEWILYRPKDGPPRTIRAIVNRNPPQPLGAASEQHTQRIEIEARNRTPDGVESRDIDRGGDKVDLSGIKGGLVTTWNVNQLLSDRGGITKFEVR